jgi:HEAT repeat protein
VTESEIRALVGRLGNVHEIFFVQGNILAVGPATVPALCDFLLSAPPSVCPEPRVAAVECLGAFGTEPARAALTRLLEHDDAVFDPAVKLAEERVRGAAARALGRLRETRAVAPLLRALERERLVAAGEALVEMNEALALPGLIACLEEPGKGPAIDAILRFGNRAVSLLVAALRAPRLVEGREPSTSTERRACCAEMLGRLHAREALDPLVAVLDDPSSAVRTEAALAVAAIAVEPPQQLAERLAEVLGDRDLERQARAEEALGRVGPHALSALLRTAQGRVGKDEPPISSGARLAAVKLLERLHEPEIVPALAPLLDEGDPRLRVAVLRTLAAQGEQAAEALRRASKDRVRFVRDAARRGLERIGEREPARLLSRWLR